MQSNDIGALSLHAHHHLQSLPKFRQAMDRLDLGRLTLELTSSYNYHITDVGKRRVNWGLNDTFNRGTL